MESRNDLVSIKGKQIVWEACQISVTIICLPLVNRVVRRDADVSHFMDPEEFEKLLALEDNFDSECINEELNSKFRRLPRHLFQAFLGETFWFSLMVVNDSVKDPMTDVVVKIDMQTCNDRVVDIGMIKSPFLDAKQSLNDVLKHEVKEPGGHVSVD